MFKINFLSANESFKETSDKTNNKVDSANLIAINSKYYGQLALNDDKDFYNLISLIPILNIFILIYSIYLIKKL